MSREKLLEFALGGTGMLAMFLGICILSAVFFIVVLPVGQFMRLFGDPMRRARQESVTSYRIASRPPDSDNMDRAFR